MKKAVDIAARAYEQAIAAAERDRLAKDAEEAERQAAKRKAHQANFNAALPLLNEWFPGVEWEWHQMGDYGYDTIVTDVNEVWPPSFRLNVKRYKNEIEIRVGDYRPDTSLPGYSYFSGTRIRSAADLGRYLLKGSNDPTR